MTNKNVIEIINRLMDPNANKVVYNATEVFTAIAHGYYYIRPGKKLGRFIDKIMKVLEKDRRKSFDKYFEENNDISSDVELWGRTVADVLTVARSMFDAEYYAKSLKVFNSITIILEVFI